MSRERPLVEPTRLRDVAAAALVGVAAGWLLLGYLPRAGQSLPIVGPGAWASVALMAAGVAAVALGTRRALKTGAPVDPKAALGRVLVGKTSALAGSALGAGYAVLALLAAQAWPVPLAQERVLHSVVAVLACAAWAGAGWWLERTCRVRESDDTPGATRVGDSDPEDRPVA